MNDWVKFKEKFLAEKKANDEALSEELRKTAAEFSERTRIELARIAREFRHAFGQDRR